jgi:hypothetical protein
MRHVNSSHNPSLANELGSLAGLYRTVFWMMGRKARYGRLWPPEAEMPARDAAYSPPTSPAVESARPHLAEVSSRD